jgi:hypothetical protein
MRATIAIANQSGAERTSWCSVHVRVDRPSWTASSIEQGRLCQGGAARVLDDELARLLGLILERLHGVCEQLPRELGVDVIAPEVAAGPEPGLRRAHEPRSPPRGGREAGLELVDPAPRRGERLLERLDPRSVGVPVAAESHRGASMSAWA